MNLLVNKEVKRFLILLLVVLFVGAASAQAAAYMNAIRFKNEMLIHDYGLAGYLHDRHPELAFEIQAAFAADKLPQHFESGKALLEQTGYSERVQLHLLPQVSEFYKTGGIVNVTASIAFSMTVLIIVYSFLKAHYRRIDRYCSDIAEIMKGNISTRLDDNEEGSLAKLASSINMLTASLHTHIRKEKQDRIFLKDIIANVSHQLKTPLSALAMYNEIMEDENTDNEVIARFLGKSGNELVRMQTLIMNLLKLARLDAGVIELNKGNYILNDIIAQVVESFETRLSKEIKVCDLESGGRITYLCDREWLLEALSNLFKNAAEHTGEGNHIKVLLEETPLMVKITFKDNGEGIHPDDINHIFKRFYRSRFSQNKQGTGIGLTLAKTIVEMHGGYISVESEFGKGATFAVDLPKLTEL